MARRILTWLLVTAAAGVAVVACNSPVPPPVTGAVALNLGNQSAGAHCPKPNTVVTLGSVDCAGSSPLTDGQNGDSVACAVKQNADGTFAVSINLSSNGVTFNMLGTIDPNNDNNTHVIASVVPPGSETYSSPSKTPCQIDLGGAGGSLGIGPGHIWAGFTCPTVTAQGSADPQPCAISSYKSCGNGTITEGGFVIAQGCEQ
jgi:hypothetical protein